MRGWTRLQHGKETLDTGSDLDLVKPNLPFFYDWTKGNGALETQECNFMKIKFYPYLILPQGPPEILIPVVPQEPSLATEKDHPRFSPITLLQFYFRKPSSLFISFRLPRGPRKHQLLHNVRCETG